MSESNPGVMLQTFVWDTKNPGTFWDDLAQRSGELADAGFTAVWLPPACKAQGGTDDVGYGIYDLYDLGEFDQKGSVETRYGSKEQLLECVKQLRDAGLLTLADIVLNHRMGADETETFLAVKVDPDDRTKTVGEPFELEAWTRFNFEGRAGKYSDFGWRWQHFDAVDSLAKVDADDQAIFRISNKSFASDVGKEMGNYDYLMGCDVNLVQDDVRAELFKWGQWFLKTTGFDGFRIDAAKHMSAAFLRDFLQHCRQDGDGEREVFSVAEYAIDDLPAIQHFLGQSDSATHCFDFPLHFRLGRASREEADFDLRTIFDETLVGQVPTQSVTFVDNHDSDPAQGGDHWVQDWFKPLAYALILLRSQGFPCVYAGDYDGQGGPDATTTSHRDLLDRLLQLRHRYACGDQHDHFDDPHCISWVRTGDEDHPGSMVVMINNHDQVTQTIDTGRPDTTFRCDDDESETVTTDADGKAEFTCPARGLAIYIVD